MLIRNIKRKEKKIIQNNIIIIIKYIIKFKLLKIIFRTNIIYYYLSF